MDKESKAAPQEILAEDIVTALLEKKLIMKSKEQQLRKKISSGQIKPEDWSLLFEISAGQAAQGEEHG